ncbi:hypothetical protein BDV23DRAFT_182450 [Aspergillus alliaceus]|uniref:Uncharacterized protein n=1 Tax=Petromyces alliaceus TaxID=209559 RepID=A0A5N7CD34_PETAA|nr:hypothetical protein BDV23DRAFT_182450 [Aspergillus alliaceus]
MDRSLGPYRFGYPDDGLARYILGDVLEQYLSCDEYFWWQNLRVGKKKFKFQVFLHTKEEEQMKIWKSFRQMKTVDRPMEDAIDLHRPRLGQFLLTWMKESELRQAKDILKEETDPHYERAIQAIENELVHKKGEDDVKHGSSCIPFKVPGSQADRQLLHFYCCQAAESLSSYTDPTLWTTLILQRSYHEPVIRHALVTLSSLYQDHLSGELSRYNTASPPPPRVLQRIAKCHRQLRSYLSTPGASPEVALTCSTVFYAFETLIGNPQQAIRHLDLGLKLLQRCQKDSPSSHMSRPDDIVPHITALFSCLDIQASVYDLSRGPPMLSLVSSNEVHGVYHVVPEALQNIAQGEAVLLKLENWFTRHLKIYADVKHKPLAQIPLEVLHEREVLEMQFERFMTAIEELYEASEERFAKRILLLRIQARMYYGVLLQRFPWPCTEALSVTTDRGSSSTSVIHRQISDHWLDTALSEISTLLDTPPGSTTSYNRPFTLSTQLVGGLLHVCLKTTSKQTLETAISLLQHPNLPSRDGLWDAKATASVIQELLAQVSGGQGAGDGTSTTVVEYSGPAVADECITQYPKLDV